MEEVINKPDNQFKELLNDIVDFSNIGKNNALIKELTHRPINTSANATTPTSVASPTSAAANTTTPNHKPASLNSSTYSSAASSSSPSSSSSSSTSSSSTSDSSSTNSASSTSSSTLSSTSQSSEVKNGTNVDIDNGYDKLEIAKIEELGKKAKLLGHRIAHHQYRYTRNGDEHASTPNPHIDNQQRQLNLDISDSSVSPQDGSRTYRQISANSKSQIINKMTSENIQAGNSWKTINGKRDKKRRKPAEQPVLSEHIPGHKGTREVDWLVNFIESGVGGTNNTNGSNKNNAKSKPQINKADNNQQTISRGKTNTKSTVPPLTQAIITKKRDNYPVKNNTKPQQSTSTKINNMPNVQTKSVARNNQDDRIETVVVQASQPTQANDESIKVTRTRKTSDKLTDDIVTFADHIRVDEKEIGQYTFGFFEEQPKSRPQSIESNKVLEAPRQAPTTRKSNQTLVENKSQPSKPSPNSEKKRRKFNGNIDVSNSFNYVQILEFISNAWESTLKSRQTKMNTNKVGR